MQRGGIAHIDEPLRLQPLRLQLLKHREVRPLKQLAHEPRRARIRLRLRRQHGAHALRRQDGVEREPRLRPVLPHPRPTSACSASVAGSRIAATASEFHVSTPTFIAFPGVGVHTAQLELVSTTRRTLYPPLTRVLGLRGLEPPQSGGRRLGQAGGESEKSIVHAVWMRAAAPWMAAS